jgi:hypothetical protein
METIEKLKLAQRTRNRNAQTWLSLDAGGILAPLVPLEIDLDTLASPCIENFMAISDEAWGIKEQQRDRTVELSQAEVEQDRAIADAKAATGRAKIAIERTADEYTLAVKVYDARVKSLIMGAKEYAALAECEQLANEESRAGLAVDKEGLRRAKVQAEIFLETIQQAQVQADFARAQVDVAKAHVRVAMAGIEAGKAEVDLIEAQTQKYVAEAEKATLHADVAMIWAEIVTKKLSEIKLDIGQKEIAAGFTYIQTKLDDMLALYDLRRLLEEIRTEAETELQGEISLSMVADKAQEDLRETEVDNARVAFTYEEDQTALNIQQDAAQREAHVLARNRLSDQRLLHSMRRDEKQSWAQELINMAQKYVHKHGQSGETTFNVEYEFISG